MGTPRWQAVRSVSEKTGLMPATCMDLLKSGWTYIDTLDQPPRWVAPVTNMKET